MQAMRQTDEVLVDIVNTIGRVKNTAPAREYYLMNTEPFTHREQIYVMNAIEKNDIDALESLMASGIDLTKSSGIALSYAVVQRSNDCVSYLIDKAGINPHVDQDAPLKLAASSNNAKAVGILLDSAKFNDYTMAKVLDMAVTSKSEDATDVLLATNQFTSKQLKQLTEGAMAMGLERMARNLISSAVTAMVSQNSAERKAKDELYRHSKEPRGKFIAV